MGMKVGGCTEGQSMRMTEIKGAGTHDTKGIAAEGCFHTDEDAVMGGWAYFSALAMALQHSINRTTREFDFIGILMYFDMIVNSIESCTLQPLCPLHRWYG